jgi:hypothetical protein
MGQVVPAIYFNDLLGLENDTESFERTGKPRDLNRHKNDLAELDLENPSDPFLSVYVRLINRILEARTEDSAFYPGSTEFEFRAITDTVFLNHPYAGGEHSFIVGNITPYRQEILMDLRSLEGVGARDLEKIRKNGLMDCLSGQFYRLEADSTLALDLPPYGAAWLRAHSQPKARS